MNIYTVNDLLEYFPTLYNVHEVKPLSELNHDEQATIIGKVISEPILNYYGPRRSRLTFTIESENVAIKVVMFNRAFAKKHIKINDINTFMGKWDAHRLQITVGQYKKGNLKNSTDIEPIYSVKGEMTSLRLKKLIALTMKQYLQYVEEFLPVNFL